MKAQKENGMDLKDELVTFLKNHSIKELMELVLEAIKISGRNN